MAKVNRLTYNCVPYFLDTALLLLHTIPGIEGGNAAEQTVWGSCLGEAAGQQWDENPRVIVQNWVWMLAKRKDFTRNKTSANSWNLKLLLAQDNNIKSVRCIQTIQKL